MGHKGALQKINLTTVLLLTGAAAVLFRKLLTMGLLPDVYVTAAAVIIAAWDITAIAVAGGQTHGKRDICTLIITFMLIGVMAAGSWLVYQIDRAMNSIIVQDETADASADASADAEEEAEVYELSDDEDIFIVYISGIDDTGDIEETVGRSDVNILAVINTQTGTVQLISTPRDYYVYLPDKNAYDKLTHAGVYGIDCSIAALEYLYDIEIDYYARVNFTGFETLIDDIGGIDIYIEESFTSNDDIYFAEGWVHMDGEMALSYARERKAFSDGDVQRGKNQMKVITAAVEQFLSGGSLMGKMIAVMSDLQSAVQTNMTSDIMYDLVRYQLSTDTEWTFSAYTVTGYNARRSVYSASTSVYVMIPDESTVEEAKALIRDTLNGVTGDESADASDDGSEEAD